MEAIEFEKGLYSQWLEAFSNIGHDLISVDTAARSMAILLEYGNNEGFVYSARFLAEKEYIEQRFGIYGTGTPDPEFVTALKHYVKMFEDFRKEHNDESAAPKWVAEFLQNRYGIKFYGKAL